jgi:hypothetical protein
MDPLTFALAYLLMGGLVTLFEDAHRPADSQRWTPAVMGALWPLHFVVFLVFFARAVIRSDGE